MDFPEMPGLYRMDWRSVNVPDPKRAQRFPALMYFDGTQWINTATGRQGIVDPTLGDRWTLVARMDDPQPKELMMENTPGRLFTHPEETTPEWPRKRAVEVISTSNDPEQLKEVCGCLLIVAEMDGILDAVRPVLLDLVEKSHSVRFPPE